MQKYCKKDVPLENEGLGSNCKKNKKIKVLKWNPPETKFFQKHVQNCFLQAPFLVDGGQIVGYYPNKKIAL